MADVLNLESKQYLKSVNTPDFASDPNWIINPDISRVKNVEVKYWALQKDTDKTVVEMSLSEKKKTDKLLEPEKQGGLSAAWNTLWK